VRGIREGSHLFNRQEEKQGSSIPGQTSKRRPLALAEAREGDKEAQTDIDADGKLLVVAFSLNIGLENLPSCSS
jgi:hypothetical protein